MTRKEARARVGIRELKAKEILVYVAAHEMHHLLAGQHRGDHSTTPDTAELSDPMVETIGAFDLERSYWRRLSVDGFTEERNADVFALGNLRAWRRRNSPFYGPRGELPG